jgi:hypothetical protein
MFYEKGWLTERQFAPPNADCASKPQFGRRRVERLEVRAGAVP